MSETDRATAAAVESPPESPYPRDNYWGERGADEDDDERSGFDDALDRGTDPSEYIAHQILRQSRDPVCSTTLLDEPWNGGRLGELCAWLFDGECIDGREKVMHKTNEEIELSDPAVHMPKESDMGTHIHSYRQHRHRRRVNEETGYMNFGESTGCWYRDEHEKRLMDEVRTWLDGTRPYMPDWKRERALQHARRLKRGGDLRDVDILEKVVRKVRQNDFNRD